MIRISAVGAWTECEAKALTDPPRESRTGVAAYVGTLAHAMVAGIEAPEPTNRMSFDAITPTYHDTYLQARAIADYAHALLLARGWMPLDYESEVWLNESVSGHTDIIAWNSELRQEAVIDLKTGRSIGAAWLQVGGYLEALGRGDKGGVLHIPRVQTHKEVRGTLELRHASELRFAWELRYGRIQEILRGASAMRSPGMHCRRCNAVCAVRI